MAGLPHDLTGPPQPAGILSVLPDRTSWLGRGRMWFR